MSDEKDRRIMDLQQRVFDRQAVITGLQSELKQGKKCNGCMSSQLRNKTPMQCTVDHDSCSWDDANKCLKQEATEANDIIVELKLKLQRYDQATRTPFIKGGRCGGTTHSACDCVIQRTAELEAELTVFRDYLKRNGYGLQLNDIDKLIILNP